MVFNLVTIFALFAFFLLLYFHNIWYWPRHYYSFYFWAISFIFSLSVCERLFRRVKNVLPWILFKCVYPLDGQSVKVCETLKEWRGLKSAAIVLYFRRWWDVVYAVYITLCATLRWFSVYFWRVVIVVNWRVSVTSSPGHVTYFIDLIY